VDEVYSNHCAGVVLVRAAFGRQSNKNETIPAKPVKSRLFVSREKVISRATSLRAPLFDKSIKKEKRRRRGPGGFVLRHGSRQILVLCVSSITMDVEASASALQK
jgi:hypothetical protein